jgi:hypothetical protein
MTFDRFNNSMSQHNNLIANNKLRRCPEHYFQNVLGFGKPDPYAKQFSYSEMIQFAKQFRDQL